MSRRSYHGIYPRLSYVKHKQLRPKKIVAIDRFIGLRVPKIIADGKGQGIKPSIPVHALIDQYNIGVSKADRLDHDHSPDYARDLRLNHPYWVPLINIRPIWISGSNPPVNDPDYHE